MLVLPITLAIFGLLRGWQERQVFRRLGFNTRRDVGGFIGYILIYQALISTAALHGYAQYVLGAARRWK